MIAILPCRGAHTLRPGQSGDASLNGLFDVIINFIVLLHINHLMRKFPRNA
jgi:ABC-type polysaccharide transport system permease subunit